MRISSLPSLASCPGWWLLRRREPDGPVGPAADTGSAAGKAIELYHAGHTPREAIALALSDSARAKYPKVDVARARRLAEGYMRDPANPQTCAIDMEREVVLDTVDARKRPLQLVGHIDQVREGDSDGVKRVWDCKAGVSSEGSKLLGAHAMQLAGYSVAGGYEPGGIIWLASYDGAGPYAGQPTHWQAPFSRADADRLLDTVRLDTAHLRDGLVCVRPGPHCAWCPSSPGVCVQRFREEPPRAEEIV